MGKHKKPTPPADVEEKVVKDVTHEHGHVVISGHSFVPAEITINVGECVCWTNEDDDVHTVLLHDFSEPSGDIQPGGSWEHTFFVTGTVVYNCEKHPDMSGCVVVVGPVPPEPITEAPPPIAAAPDVIEPEPVIAAKPPTFTFTDGDRNVRTFTEADAINFLMERGFMIGTPALLESITGSVALEIPAKGASPGGVLRRSK